VSNVLICELRGHPRNYNRHSEDQIKRLMESLKRFGQPKEIVIWAVEADAPRLIIAGHGLVEAGLRLGWESLRASDMTGVWSETEALAFLAADNELARLADPDEAALAQLAAELNNVDEELAALAAGTKEWLYELVALMGSVEQGEDAGSQVDRAEELRAKWAVEVGQLWRLGDHRLICGDCTDPGVVSRLMAGEVADIMVTDPPYGVQYSPEWRVAAGLGHSERMGKVENDDRASWAMAFRLFQGNVTYVWHAGLLGATVERALATCGFELRSQIIWVKNRFALSRGQYHWRHETCFYAVRRGRSPGWAGGRKQQTVWAEVVDGWQPQADLFAARVDADTLVAFDSHTTTVWEIAAGGQDSKTIHSTQKPLECFERPLLHHMPVTGIVYEPFCGSGTAIIACERLGRRCRAVELSPGYVAAALERWAIFTGQTPVLETSDGWIEPDTAEINVATAVRAGEDR